MPTQISFIIPCYNCFKTLTETVYSILNAGLENFEICMVDDGSSDDTWRLIQSLKNKHPSIINIGKNQRNMGGGYTRNACIKLANYPYIFCLDSDNCLDRDSIRQMVNSVSDSDDIYAFSKINFMLSFQKIKLFYKEWVFVKSEMSFIDLRKTFEHPVSSGNFLFNKRVLLKVCGYESDVGALDAYSFGYKALVNGYKIKLVKGTYFHRVSPKSYWMRESKKNNENLRKLLLRFPQRFSRAEVGVLNTTDNVFKFMIISENNFVKSHTFFPFNILLKIYYWLFHR